MPSVARVIGRQLRQAGVRFAMGHPGGEVVELIEGFREEGLEFVMTHHETVGAFMADAMGHLQGVPGVCVGTLGPGATNLATGVAQAHLDRSPVIVLTGQLPAERYDIVTHQKIDLGALFAPITKWHAQVLPANVEKVTARALRVATAPRPGPVHLQVASDVAGVESTDAPTEAADIYEPPPSVSSDGIDAARRLLRGSRRPLIMVGIDAMREDVVGPLRRVAEEWSIPVMVGPKAKGMFREDHELFLGTIEMLGTGMLFDFVDECDLVVMVGMEPVEFDRDWTAAARILHISQLPNDDQYFGSELELIGDVATTLRALTDGAAASPRWSADDVRVRRRKFLEHTHPMVDGLSAQEVLGELRSVLREDALVTCDVGYNKSVAGQCWPAYEPRTFFMSNGLSTMGYGFASAMALKMLEPERQVACIVGDGGLGMFLGDLETAARRGLHMTIVVLADRALSQIKLNQQRRGFPATGTEFGGIDYPVLAQAMGCVGRDVSTPDECRAAFEWALTTGKPTIVAAHINPQCYVLS